MINKVIEAGGKEYKKWQEYGWIFEHSFQDIDRHLWEIIFMEERAVNQRKKNYKR